MIIKKNKRDILFAAFLIKNSAELSAVSVCIAFKTLMCFNNVAV